MFLGTKAGSFCSILPLLTEGTCCCHPHNVVSRLFQVSLRWVSGVFLSPTRHISAEMEPGKCAMMDEDSQWPFQEQNWPVCPAAEKPGWSLDSLLTAWTHSSVGRSGQDSWSTALPWGRSARSLISKGSRRFGGERCFQMQSLRSVLSQGRLVLNKMVVAHGVPNMRECLGHSSYWGNIFLLAGCN